ncbi:4Fe-4S ferredoxin [Lusitaniella coriacea LEGE 07157]|uniref:4Fe-4S ferredoxin n=1 Tax=Lusitaniella coriacea LEGE 07157 TaxID=945747 RepID=A0A8J7IUU6_9CYAN|nr:LdpA C-terminal domain-containing domain [Lusitaniella coriacea]MBE9116788.1 4Fe-4S ferredoxin [Lusitaniella coriacea LEGE 07157]
MDELYSPLNALRSGRWFKLICGASFQHLPAVRNLALVYTLAGADCIDVAADQAVIVAVQEALAVAQSLTELAAQRGFHRKGRPWLMVSLNDGEDPHFRKAEFDATQCPSDCPRPCEAICPAQAIAFSPEKPIESGVIDERCYGCGRCLPVCPSQLIFARSFVSTPSAIAATLNPLNIDAIEIHTHAGNFEDFTRLWREISPLRDRLKLLAISCPDHPQLIPYLQSLYDFIAPLPHPLVWQTDGRPMSGDIGKGATRAAVKLAQKVLAAKLPGHVQLAGGTNEYTVTKLKTQGLLQLARRESLTFNLSPFPKHPPDVLRATESYHDPSSVSGVAYGSYARSLLSPLLNQLETRNAENPISTRPQLEKHPDLLWQAVAIAHSLVSQLKPVQVNL